MNQSNLVILIVLSLMLTGCDLFSANKPAGHIPVTFSDLTAKGDCGSKIRLNNQFWDVDYLAFYLSEPRVRIGGRWQALSFEPGQGQSSTTALLKFHDRCTSNSNDTTIKLDANETLLNRASAVRFTLGLPFSQNHLLDDVHDSPVNEPAMFQSARVGHTFMRIELKQSDNTSNWWSFLLASGGCDASSDEQAPDQCQKPNRITVDLPLKANVETLRLNALLRKILFRAELVPGQACNYGEQPADNCNKVLRNLTNNQWLVWDAPQQVYLKQN
ncbi:MbnP family protein [Salinimonas chungwhensis]|uniref:MbnP family protein n=1 Tax=Salinimonas chungwhensis TaxID=265425 RepID=UPI000366AFF3|nr:MbnP family protein [Salinimonas chungwhensis]